MKHHTICGTLAATCWLMAAATPVAAQTIYTNRAAFLAATTNQAVTDFNNLGSGSGQGQSYAGTDFTLTTGSSLLISYNPNSSPDYQFNSGTVLALARISATSGTFTPATGVTAFGFDFGVLAGAPTAVTINGVDYTASGAPTLDFFGIVASSGVAPISVSFAASRGIFDNVTVASAAPQAVDPVPEPVTWATMILGFSLVGGALRRRDRVSIRCA